MHRKGVEHSFRSSSTVHTDRNLHVDNVPAALWWWSLLCAIGEADVDACRWTTCPLRGDLPYL